MYPAPHQEFRFKHTALFNNVGKKDVILLNTESDSLNMEKYKRCRTANLDIQNTQP
jgi:hypothetical protein